MISITYFDTLTGGDSSKGKRADFSNISEMVEAFKLRAIDYAPIVNKYGDHNAKSFHLPVFIPGDMSGKKKCKDSLSGGLQVCVLDIDDTLSMEDFLKNAKFECYVATTMSHSSVDYDKYRVFIPISRPLTKTEVSRKKFVARVAKTIGISDPEVIDGKCAVDYGRGYVLPDTSAEWFTIDGPIIDIDNLEEVEVKLAKKKKANRVKRANAVSGLDDVSDLDIVALFQAKGLIVANRGAGKYEVTCPWGDEHSNGDPSGAFIVDTGNISVFVCNHDTCSSRDAIDVMSKFGDVSSYRRKSDIDPVNDPNIDANIRRYFDSIKFSTDIPSSKEEVLCRYYTISDRRKKVYDAATNSILDQDAIERAVGTRIKVMGQFGLQAWSFSSDKRHRMIQGNMITFAPGEKLKSPFFNTFKGLGYDDISVSKEDEEKCYEEVMRLFSYFCDGNKGYAQTLLKWCAYPFVHNFDKCLWSPVLRTRTTGTGKSMFFEDIMIKLYNYAFNKGGRLDSSMEYGTKIRDADLRSRFNSWADGTLYIAANEINRGKRDTIETANMIKDIITGKEIVIERKGLDSKVVPSKFQMIILSNENLPVHIDRNDRRFFVIGTDDERMEYSEYDYFFTVLMERPEVLYQMLKNVTVDKKFGYTAPEHTELHNAMVRDSALPTARFVEEYLAGELGVNPTKPFALKEMKRLMEEWWINEGLNKRPKRAHLVSSLEARGIYDQGTGKDDDRKTIRYWGARKATGTINLDETTIQIRDSTKAILEGTEIKRVPVAR